MLNRLREMGITYGIIPRKGSKVRRDGSVRDDAVRELRSAVESFCGF